MRRAGILTGGIAALILLAGVYVPQHPSSPSMTRNSVDHNRLWFDRASLSTGDTSEASKQHQPIEFPTEGMSDL